MLHLIYSALLSRNSLIDIYDWIICTNSSNAIEDKAIINVGQPIFSTCAENSRLKFENIFKII